MQAQADDARSGKVHRGPARRPGAQSASAPCPAVKKRAGALFPAINDVGVYVGDDDFPLNEAVEVPYPVSVPTHCRRDPYPACCAARPP